MPPDMILLFKTNGRAMAGNYRDRDCKWHISFPTASLIHIPFSVIL